MSEQESTVAIQKRQRTEKPSAELQAKRQRKLTVYVGPDRPFGVPMRRNSLLIGNPFSQLENVLKEHPEIQDLLIPVEKLAETRLQLRTKGSRLQRLFVTVSEASRKVRKPKE